MEVSLSGLRKLGRGKEMDISWEWIRLEKNGQQQPRMNCQIPTRQGENKTSPSNSMESVPGEQVWVDNLEASARVKT